MARHRSAATTPSFGARAKALIAGAGLIAGSILGVIALWDRFFPADTVDAATITSVEIVRQSTLGEFTKVGPGDDALIAPLTLTGGRDADTRAAAYTAPTGTAPTGPPPATTAAPPVAFPSPSITSSSSSPTSSSATPSPSTPDTATPDTGPSGEASSPPPPRRVDAYRQAVNDPSLQEYELTEEEALLLGLRNAVISRPESVDPSDPTGDELTAEEVAQALTEALSHVQAERTATRLEPLGWTVAVDVTLEGFKDEPLLLTWSLGGLDVPTRWATPTVATRLVATSPRDTGSAQVWVPRLKESGTFQLNVELRLESAPRITVARAALAELPSVPTPSRE